MDLNYNILTWDFSLSVMCKIKVCHEILELTRLQCSSPLREMTLVASEKVDTLNLPREFKNSMKNMLMPMLAELINWYSLFPLGIRPIMTPHGTIDLAKSTGVDLEFSQHIHLPHLLKNLSRAWKSTPKLHRLLTPYIESHKTILQRGRDSGSLTCKFDDCYFCTRVRVKKSDFVIPEDELPETQSHFAAKDQEYTPGFGDAYEKYCMVEIKPVDVNERANEYLSSLISQWRTYSPATYAFLYKSLSEFDQMCVYDLGNYSSNILLGLLQWPYQHLFMEAAKLLIVNIPSITYWIALENMLKKANGGYRDWDYRGLFAEFFQMKGCRRSTFKETELYQRFVFTAFVLWDEHILNLVLDAASPEDKMKLLMGVRRHMEETSANEIDYDKIEWFIRECGMQSRYMLEALKEDLVCNAPTFCSQNLYKRFTQLWTKDEWTECHARIIEITDKIIAEIPNEDEITQ